MERSKEQIRAARLNLSLIVRPEAEHDLATTQAWYEASRPGLGAEFRAAVAHVMELIILHPHLYAAVYKKVRRALLMRFPYAVFYRIEAHSVVVLACIHIKRNPKLARSLIYTRRA